MNNDLILLKMTGGAPTGGKTSTVNHEWKTVVGQIKLKALISRLGIVGLTNRNLIAR